jgi:hypothetical protein
MSIDADKKLAARCFGIVGGTLVGFGAAAVRYAWWGDFPPRQPVLCVFFLLGGALAVLLGGIASYVSTSLLKTSRLGHGLRWVLVPAVLAFVAGSWWLD